MQKHPKSDRNVQKSCSVTTWTAFADRVCREWGSGLLAELSLPNLMEQPRPLLALSDHTTSRALTILVRLNRTPL